MNCTDSWRSSVDTPMDVERILVDPDIDPNFHLLLTEPSPFDIYSDEPQIISEKKDDSLTKPNDPEVV